MKARVPVLLALLLVLTGITGESYWESVNLLDREIFSDEGVYSMSEDELGAAASAKGEKCRLAFSALSPCFRKSRLIVSELKPLFERHFLGPDGDLVLEPSPFHGSTFPSWAEKNGAFFAAAARHFRGDRTLSLVEMAHPSFKIEMMRQEKGKLLKAALFPAGYAYNCGEGSREGVVFSPSLGYCYGGGGCEKCMSSARLEFFGSKEYLKEVSSLRPTGIKEGSYASFMFDENGILPAAGKIK